MRLHRRGLACSKCVEGTDKSDVPRRQKCSIAATKVKTASTDDKTVPMDNKTEPTDDKTMTMFGSSFFCESGRAVLLLIISGLHTSDGP